MERTRRISLAELRFSKLSNIDYVKQVGQIIRGCKPAIHSFMIRLLVAPIIEHTITKYHIRAQTPVQLMIFYINILFNPKELKKLGIPSRELPIKRIPIKSITHVERSAIMIECLNRAIRYLNQADNCGIKEVDTLADHDINFLRKTLTKILDIEKLYRAEFHLAFRIN